MTSKEASQQAMLVMASGRGGGAAEGGVFCCLARVLLPVAHLFQKLPGLFFVDKREAGEAVLEFEGMEEDPLLVVAPVLKDFLIPDDAAVGRLEAAWRG